MCTTLGGETPPAQGGIQILGTGDVSATMHDKFQQSSPKWMVPLFSSSTEWWILPSCYRDRYAQCQTVLFWTGIDMPVVVHVKVVDNPVMAQRPFFSVQFSSPLRFSSCSPLIRCSMSLVQAVRNWSRSHSCTRDIRAQTRSFTRPLCVTTVPG